MEALFNRQWTCTVKKLPEGLQAETHYLDTTQEMSVQMIVEPHTFAVIRASAEVYRSPKGKEYCKAREVSELAGVIAYFDASKKLRQIKWENDLEQFLFAESIRGIIQAETFLLPERGFASDAAYEEYWRQMYRNSCRYYSNLDQVKRLWLEHVAEQKRFGHLFARHYSHTVFTAKDKPSQLILTGAFNDSFHELNLVIELNNTNDTVVAAYARMLRGPDDVCYEGMKETVNLTYKPLMFLQEKRELANLLGGQNGCVHLIDLAYSLVQTLRQYKMWSVGDRG